VKRAVLILSLIAPILMFVIGGFFFAASGFGIDFEAPPTSPQRVVGALIGYIPGLVLAIVALALSLSATARSRQVGWFIGLLVWPVVPLVAAVLMARRSLPAALDLDLWRNRPRASDGRSPAAGATIQQFACAVPGVRRRSHARDPAWLHVTCARRASVLFATRRDANKRPSRAECAQGRRRRELRDWLVSTRDCHQHHSTDGFVVGKCERSRCHRHATNREPGYRGFYSGRTIGAGDDDHFLHSRLHRARRRIACQNRVCLQIAYSGGGVCAWLDLPCPAT